MIITSDDLILDVLEVANVDDDEDAVRDVFGSPVFLTADASFIQIYIKIKILNINLYWILMFLLPVGNREKPGFLRPLGLFGSIF